MSITVLPKHLPVKRYLYYGFVLFVLVFLVQQRDAALGQAVAQQEKAEATQQARPEPVAVESPSPSQATVEQGKPNVEAQKSPDHPADAFWDVKLTDLIQVAINVVLLFVVYWQARINREQRREMKRQVDIMEGELEVTRESVKQSERALLASEVQADAAKQSVLIARETFYIGERPYFGITKMEMELVNHKPYVTIEFENGGKTPAWRFYALVWLTIGDHPTDETLRWNLNTHASPYTHSYFGVAQRHDFTFNNPNILFTGKQLQDVQNDQVRVFVHGTAHYKDMRGVALHRNFTGLWHYPRGVFSDWEA